MKAVTLIKHGAAEKAFEMREIPTPSPSEDEVLIKIDAFGLNYADVMARNGLYKDAPPMPSIIGYEVVGHIEQLGSKVENLSSGQRVVAFTRFGGYAEYVSTNARAVVPIPDDMPNGEAAAMATQYGTAYYCAHEMVNLSEGDHVLVHAAAGGVGTALVQMAKRKGCIVYGTVGSDEKLEYLKRQGVDHPINYRNSDFVEEIMKLRGEDRMDIIFDSVGGSNYRRSKKILAYGGRLVGYGMAERSGRFGGIFATLKVVLDFGFLHPIMLLMNSQAMIGVNMLPIGDHKPHVLERCIKNVVEMVNNGELKPHVGGVYKVDEIAAAHSLLESRKSVGKIIVEW